MPNLIMEYTNSVDERSNVQLLLEELHQGMMDSELFEISSIKSRAIRLNQWLIGEHQDREDFIHVTVELLKGRTDEEKGRLAEKLIQILAKNAVHIESLTVNIRDMEPLYFRKFAHNVL
ncbi:5-carboxymethyl-2-hydroxymuconate Delta-isomerase [Vibrio sp.]|nr:5-carboxymethyl-2-hydroxymuconate Delta-isomerase [Vibrio sp.]